MATEMFSTFILIYDEVAVSSRPGEGVVEVIASEQLLNVAEPVLEHLSQIDWSSGVLAAGIFVNGKWVIHTRSEVEELLMNVADERMAPAQP